MKKTILTLLIPVIVLCSFSACTSLQQNTSNSNPVLGAVQGVLHKGTSTAFDVFGDSEEFLTNKLIESALPKELRDINTKLESIGLSQIVKKEKQYISQIAKTTINKASPVLKNAINQMTLSDALNIIASGEGSATRYLKTKTSSDLNAIIKPIVSEQTKKLGLDTLMDNALGGNNDALNGLLGTILTGGSDQNVSQLIDDAVTEQLITGLFKIVEDVENTTRANPGTLLNSLIETKN